MRKRSGRFDRRGMEPGPARFRRRMARGRGLWKVGAFLASAALFVTGLELLLT